MMLFDIQRNSSVDGPGVRTTVFFKGCNLKCEWCHNPESQSGKKQMLFYKNRCKNCGMCLKKCPTGGIYNPEKCTFCGQCEFYCLQDARKICGKDYTVDEVMDIIEKDRSFYNVSGGGVTFSGGECMLQIDSLCELLKSCKDRGIHTAVDTAGHVPWESFELILPYTDLFLYDVKSMIPQVHKKYTGADNKEILDNLAKLMETKKRIWVRFPVIPTVNDTLDEMKLLINFFDKHGYPEKTELLPYHSMGNVKYEALGREYSSFPNVNPETMKTMEIFLQSAFSANELTTEKNNIANNLPTKC